MKNTKNILFGTVLGVFFAFGILGSSCSKWTQPEAEDFYEGPSQSYTDNIGDYQGSPHKVMFGWFGNWAGDGGSMQYQLMGLPDSVDLVSLWLCYGNLTPGQQRDLAAFQARGGKAYLCWTARNIGEGLTDNYMKLDDGTILTRDEWKLETGKSDDDWRKKFWGFEDGSDSSKLAATVKFAMALADTCRKYNIDGYDYDMEALGDLCTGSDTTLINTFFRTLITEFKKDGRNLNIDIPGGTGWLSYYVMVADDVLRDIKYLIWQTYELSPSGLESFFYSSGAGVRARNPEMFETVFSKSIVTATFERAVDKHYFLEQMAWKPSFGLDYAGHGAYHIEYDYPDATTKDHDDYGVNLGVDYPHVRKGISILNPPILK